MIETNRTDPCKIVSGEVADHLFEALAPLQHMLRAHHLPCMRVRIISLTLRGPEPVTLPCYRLPALEVWDREGKVVAVITLAAGSHWFSVLIPERDEPCLVPVDRPQRVVRILRETLLEL